MVKKKKKICVGLSIKDRKQWGGRLVKEVDARFINVFKIKCWGEKTCLFVLFCFFGIPLLVHSSQWKEIQSKGTDMGNATYFN